MAVLPSAGGADTVGILIATTADNAGIDATKAGLAEVNTEAKNLNDKGASTLENFNSSLKNVGQQATAVGKTMSTFITAPIVGIGYESIKMAMSFQQSMELLHTNAGTAQKDIAGLSTAVLNMAGQVGAKPEELAQALYHIASAGNGLWNTAKQLDILKVAAEGAKIGQAGVEETTNALTFAMSSNVKGAKDATQMMSVLTAIVGAGDMRMENLNAAMGTGFLGTAASFGISIQSVGAALATLTDTGMSADSAATRLRMTWALMASPSKQAATQLEALGLTSDGAAKAADNMNAVFSKSGLTTTKLAVDLQQPNGMNVALQDLSDHLKAAGLNSAEVDAMLAKAFGGGRSNAAILTLLQNLDRTNEKFKTINDTTTQFGEKWAQQQETAKQKWDQAWAGIQADLIRIGTQLLPVVATAMGHVSNAVNDVLNWFNRLTPYEKNLFKDLLIALAVGGPVLVALGTLATSISSIITLVTTLTGLFSTAMPAAASAGAAGVVGAFSAILTGALGLLGEISILGGALNHLQDIQYNSSKNKSANPYSPQSQSAQTAPGSFLNNLLTGGLKHASGTNYSPGGWAMVGEQGPEMMYVPRGSQVKTNSQSGGGGSSSTSVQIGTIILGTAAAASEFFRQLNQDTMNLGKGLTATQGVR